MKATYIFLIIFSCLILTQCHLDMCGNDIYQRVDNERGTYKIVKFSRDCGATTGSSIQISILPENEELPSEAGNTFISKGSINFDTTVKMKWLNDSVVQIIHGTGLEIFLKDSIVGKVKVVYKTE